MDYITKPLSRITIRKFSKIVRKIFGCKSDDEPFPVLEALEMLPDIVENTNKEYEIVCAIGGKYFRIQRQPYTDSKGRYHGKEYVGLNLKSPSIPGTFQGKARKAEMNRLTHFAMTYKKGTI